MKALEQLGGRAHLWEIYLAVENLRRAARVPLSNTWKATVRRELQQCGHCEPIAGERGWWRLRKRTRASR